MVDALRRSNPTLPAIKPEEPAKPAPAPAPATQTATADGFDSAPALRQSSPGMDSFTATQVPQDAGFFSKMKSLFSGVGSSALKQLDASAVKLDGLAQKDPTAPKASEAEENKDVTADMKPEEKERYDALTDAERAQYNELARAAKNAADPEKAQAEVKKLLNEGKIEAYMAVAAQADPDHQQKLQELLFNGKLLDGKKGETLLDALAPFASNGDPSDPAHNTTQTGVSRSQLVNQIIDDVTNPENASRQPGDDRHCGLLAVMGSLARENPAAYAAMMTKLAEEGSVTLKDAKGNEVTVTYSGPPDPKGELSLTQQIFVKTIEDFANGVKGGGGFIDQLVGAIDEYTGMTAKEMADFKAAIMQTPYSPMTVPDEQEATEQARQELGPDASEAEVAARAKEIREKAQAQAKETLDEQVAAGEQVQVEVNGPPPHWETVTGKVEMDLPPFGKIELYLVDDGTGHVKLMTPDQLESEMGGMIYNPAVSDVPADAYNAKDDDPGIGFNSGGGNGDGGL